MSGCRPDQRYHPEASRNRRVLPREGHLLHRCRRPGFVRVSLLVDV